MKDGWGLVVPEDMYQGQEGRDQKHQGQEYQGHHCDDTGSQPMAHEASIPASQIRAWVIMNQWSNFTKKTMIEIS